MKLLSSSLVFNGWHFCTEVNIFVFLFVCFFRLLSRAVQRWRDRWQDQLWLSRVNEFFIPFLIFHILSQPSSLLLLPWDMRLPWFSDHPEVLTTYSFNYFHSTTHSDSSSSCCTTICIMSKSYGAAIQYLAAVLTLRQTCFSCCWSVHGRGDLFTNGLFRGPSCMCMYDPGVYNVHRRTNGFVFVAFSLFVALSVMILLCNGHHFSQKHDAHDCQRNWFVLLFSFFYILSNYKMTVTK